MTAGGRREGEGRTSSIVGGCRAAEMSGSGLNSVTGLTWVDDCPKAAPVTPMAM
jgi:hypothetical protein